MATLVSTVMRVWSDRSLQGIRNKIPTSQQAEQDVEHRTCPSNFHLPPTPILPPKELPRVFIPWLLSQHSTTMTLAAQVITGVQRSGVKLGTYLTKVQGSLGIFPLEDFRREPISAPSQLRGTTPVAHGFSATSEHLPSSSSHSESLAPRAAFFPNSSPHARLFS